jgi:ParB family chromosome partitioning protein
MEDPSSPAGTPAVLSADLPYRKFRIDQIKTSRFQARRTFEEEPLRNLAESMKEDGLNQPIGIRFLPDGSGELLFGERRLRAAKLLGWTEIEAKVYPALSDQEAAIKGLIENLQREGLNAIERAIGYVNLAHTGLTQDQIAEKVGLSDRDTVFRYMALLGLPVEVQEMLSRDSITETHIRYLNRIKDPTQFKEMAKKASDEGWSVKETEKQVNKLLGKGPKAASSDKPQADSSKLAATQPDPLADVWESAKSKLDFAAGGDWDVSFSKKKTKLGGNQVGWDIRVAPSNSLKVAALAVWLKRISEAVVAKADPKEIENIESQLAQAKQIPQALSRAVPAASTTPTAGIQGDGQDHKIGRLPETP